ncbi:MAG: hypothetical protein GY906_29250, partial [bacterium]|nr:hypothetical protein [bacterium]
HFNHNIFFDHDNNPRDDHDHKLHHHHGPNNNDILIHDDELCAGNDDIFVGYFYNESDYDLVKYGPRDHDHDDSL